MQYLSDLIYRVWSKFLTVFGNIYLAFSPPGVTAKDMRELLDLVQPGDVVCRTYHYYLDSYFIKGKYSHSGIVVGYGTVIHAVAEGVSYIDVLDFVKDCDGFVLLRPRKPYDPALAISFAKGQLGRPYDFVFQRGPDAWYCHELARYALLQGGVQMTARDEEKYVLYDDVAAVCDVIYETAG